jgi:hypothetical protein
MLSPQPIQLVKYLGIGKNKIPADSKRLFYLSYEDALWDILKKKDVREGSDVLVPDFFCRDVEKNIKSHNYKVIYYHINGDLSADAGSFEDQIKKHKPAVIIVFHPAGIASNLLKNRAWIKSLDEKVILIEDSVHRTLDPLKIKIFRKNHFVINSLRKVVPLQGSSVYGLKNDLDFDIPPPYQSFFYSLKVHLLWFLMNISWNTGQFILAEKLMVRGYDLIGKSILPAKGLLPFKILEEFLNYDKISKTKSEQATLYETRLKGLTKNPVAYQKSDFGEMRAWPVILDKEIADKTLQCLRSKGLIVRFELEDSDWSKKQKIIYLPMGPYLKKSEQTKICEIVLESFCKLGSHPKL